MAQAPGALFFSWCRNTWGVGSTFFLNRFPGRDPKKKGRKKRVRGQKSLTKGQWCAAGATLPRRTAPEEKNKRAEGGFEPLGR